MRNVEIENTGNLVKFIREKQGLKQIDLAGRSGITPTKIGQIERGLVRCNRQSACKIALALGKDPSEVFPNFKDLRRW